MTRSFKSGKPSLKFDLSGIVLLQLGARSLDLATITARDATAQAAIDAFAEQHDGRLDDYFYLPLRGKNQDFVLALSATDGMPASWIPISPWLEDY